MSTFAELTAEVLAHRFSPTKYETFVHGWLNEGQRDVALRADIRTGQSVSTITTAAGTATANLPADFARFISLTSSSRSVERLELREFDDLSPSTGTPSCYVIIGTAINFYPTPDATYTLQLRYWRLPAVMVDPNDVPELPLQYHHLLVRYALIRCYQRENDYTAASYEQDQYETDLAKLRGQAQYDTHDQPSQVQGSWMDDNFILPNQWS